MWWCFVCRYTGLKFVVYGTSHESVRKVVQANYSVQGRGIVSRFGNVERAMYFVHKLDYICLGACSSVRPALLRLIKINSHES